jgi:hypothetical protein
MPNGPTTAQRLEVWERFKWGLDWVGRLQLVWALLLLMVGAVAVVVGWLQPVAPLAVAGIILFALDLLLLTVLAVSRGSRWISKAEGIPTSSAEFHAARLLVLGELETTANRIDIVRMTRPHPHYSYNFSLSTTQWEAYGKVLAGSSPDVFKVLARAYNAIQWVNDAQVMRRTRQGASQVPLAVIEDDHLDDAERATAAAIAALRNGGPRSANVGVGRRVEAKPKAVGREWGYGRAIEGRLVTAFVSVTVIVRGLDTDEGLVSLTCDLHRNGDAILSLPLSDPSWLLTAKGPQISRDVMFEQTFTQSDHGSAPRVTPGDELEPRIIAHFSVDRSTGTFVLPTIRVRSSYAGPGT